MGDIKQSLIICGLRGRRRVTALFDSGAQTSFIRYDIAQAIGTLNLGDMSYILSDGSESVGYLTVFTIQIRNRYSSVNAIVTRHMDEELIIGSDFMQVNDMVLDLSRDTYSFPSTAPRRRRIYRM